jgi:hypothetical protein
MSSVAKPDRRIKKERAGEEGRGGTFFGDTACSGQNNKPSQSDFQAYYPIFRFP